MAIIDAFGEGMRVLSTDSDSPPAGSKSPGSRSEDWGCASEIAQADLHSDHEIGSFSDADIQGRGGDLLNALRSRGGRPSSMQAPFTALQYPLLQLSDSNLQSRTEATLNLLNNLLGSAIMVMPRAFANVGLLNGAILMVLMAMANRYTLLVVLRMSLTALEQEEPSYPEIGKRVFGRQGILAVLLSYVLLCGGCLIGMTIALSDVLRQLINVDLPRFAWVLLAVLLCAPGAMLKTLKSVAFLSGVCMVGVGTIVVLLTVICLSDILLPPEQSALSGVGVVMKEAVTTSLPAPEVQEHHVHWMIPDLRGLFVTTSIFALQFSIQAGGIEVLTRIAPDEDAAESNSDGHDSSGLVIAERITTLAFALAALASGTCGIAGYLRFGDGVKGNVMLNFGEGEHVLPMTLIRIAYVFVITCSFAFIIVPCRFAAYDLFGLRRRNVAGDSQETVSHRTAHKTTGVILLVCLVVAMFVSDLATMFNYVGVWSTTAIAFILPCAFQIELRRRQEGISYASTENVWLLALMMLGFGILIGNTSEWILEFFEEAAPAEIIPPIPLTSPPPSVVATTQAPVLPMPSPAPLPLGQEPQ